jgi:HK97 family phage portal protein
MSIVKNIGSWMREKLNPAQSRIYVDTGTDVSTSANLNYQKSFDTLDSVNRGVNLIVSACSGLDYDIRDSVSEPVYAGMRKKQLNTLLNFRPNPYQSAQDFRQNLFTDFLLEGNCFVYFDGAHLYHLPAQQVDILPDDRTFIRGYKYGSDVDFKPSEVFSFRDLSSDSIYRGDSRLQSVISSVRTLQSMGELQQNFFDNGAVFGTVLTTDNTLSQAAKDRTIEGWLQKYNPRKGLRKPVILDSGLKPFQLTQASFRDMDFDAAIRTHSERVLTALGVPPILLAGGNNANISPNLRLFYLETVLPIVRRYTSAIERFFGYDVEAVTASVSALQPELKDIAAYHATLVNGGIISPNEARVELRYPPKTGHDDLRIPANIAGSASNPSVGGRPEQE